MQSGTRDVFSCSAINLCISSETDNVVTLGEYRRTVWLPRCWWRRERRRGRSARRPGGPRRGRRVVPANLLREKEGGGRGGRGLIDCLRFVVVVRRLALVLCVLRKGDDEKKNSVLGRVKLDEYDI